MGQGPSQLSQYPNGFPYGVTIRGVPLTVAQPGNVYWVNTTSVLPTGGVAGNDAPYPTAGTYLRPFASLDYAIGQCTAGRGDIIILMPGSTATVSAAGSITCDVAGVAIIGLGSGTTMPTISFTTATTASIVVSAANVSFTNVRFSAGFADVVKAFTLTAKNFTLQNCEVVQSAVDLNIISLTTMGATDNQCDGLTITGCTIIHPDAATTSLFTTSGDVDRVVIKDNYINLGVNASNLPIVATAATGKDFTNIQIVGNQMIRLNTANPLVLVSDTTTANTGEIAYNNIRHLDTAAELLVTAGTNISFTQNLCSAVVDTSGYLVPVADS
jgi:hypothetical protein